MYYIDHINETIENFFLCTHLPIKAFNQEGTLIHSVGYDSTLESLFSKSKIFNLLEGDIVEKVSSLSKSISFYHIKFTIAPICPKFSDKGYYIIGPYVTDEDNNSTIIYKPDFCINYLVRLLHDIASEIIPENIKKLLSTPAYSFHVRKAIDYINTNYVDSLTLDGISKYLNINKSYFCNLFKTETGKTFSQFLNEVRISESKKLLLETSLSILDIALSVGFNNQNYYTMVFKKFNDKTPLEFRNCS